MGGDKNQIKILIVDDNQRAIDGLDMLLSQYEFVEIIGAYNNGLELIDSGKLKNADVVLMDIEMPVMNGLETAKRLRYAYPKVKLIAVSMYRHQLYLRDIKTSGFHGFVEKGKVAEDLLTVIEKVTSGISIFPDRLEA